MFAKIAAFEFRYQVKSALFIASATFFFLAAFVDMGVSKMMQDAGGTILFNSPHSIIRTHIFASVLFVFVGAAFVSNVIVRDDQTGFGPIVRATGIQKFDYLFGRLTGALGAGVLVMAMATFGTWLGTLMPFGNQDMMGPNHVSGFLYGFFYVVLPNAVIVSAILFALTTATRSTGGTFVGVILILIFYLFAQRFAQDMVGADDLRALIDPLGMSPWVIAARYLTAAEINAGAVPVTSAMLTGKLVWVGLAAILLALTYLRFNFAERRLSGRQRIKLRKQPAGEQQWGTASSAEPFMRLPRPTFGDRTAVAQFFARARIEARYILRSYPFWVLLLIAFGFTLPVLMTPGSIFGVPVYPDTASYIGLISTNFGFLLVVIAAYYGGELVWRERERNVHEIVDAAPMPSWALVIPKFVGLGIVLIATLVVGMGAGILLQLIDGATAPDLGQYLVFLLLPVGADALIIAALAIFVQSLSPGKYLGWGVMVVYILLTLFGPSLGLQHPLLIFGSTPGVSPNPMSGPGFYWAAAWWLRLFWAACAILLLLAAYLLWPRGTEQRFVPRLRALPSRLWGAAGAFAGGALAVLLLSGGWIVYNSTILNEFRTGEDTLAYLAEYERRFLPFAELPQPVVDHVQLEIALHPDILRADVRGRYRLVNKTGRPIDQVHVRLADRRLELLALQLPGATLQRDEAQFGYRIYRLERPMRPGEARTLAFRTRRQQRGFRLSDAEGGFTANGAELNAFDLTPRIGMHDAGLISDPAVRREFGLPEADPLPRLEDERAVNMLLSDNAWITADITVSTDGDQIPVAPGRKLFERVENDRRIARFVSDTPIQNEFAVLSGRYAVAEGSRGGIDFAIYHHPDHGWNIGRMMNAMEASMAYFERSFGPYQFDQFRIVQVANRDGGHAYPGMIAMGAKGGFAMDMRDNDTIDMVSVFVAHELSHQWWGHQLRPTRMQGAGVLIETLAQYSSLMVLEKLRGTDQVRRLLNQQLDRYLSGRRVTIGGESPLVRAGIGDGDILYGKGSIAMYLLQRRMGEEAVNRALRRFVDRHRFSTPPYPRSADLVAAFREEAKTQQQQALVSDLFERITLYDLKVGEPVAIRRADGRWEVTVPVEAGKIYADGEGRERPAPLREPIEIGLFDSQPGASALGTGEVLALAARTLRSGRQEVRFVTDRKPAFAMIDPMGLHIDRNFADNVAPVVSGSR